MAYHYTDLITYESFNIVMNTCMIEYMDATLLKHMCGKKPGTKVEKIVLNPKDGSWKIPKRPVHVSAPKKTFVEFKGVHTRFEDSDASLDKEQSNGSGEKKKSLGSGEKKKSGNKDTSLDKDLEYIPNDVKSSTFKVFQGRKRVNKIYKEYDYCFYDEFSKYIYDLGSGSKDTIAVNDSDNLIRVAGIDLEPQFELKKRYKLPFGNYSIVRIY